MRHRPIATRSAVLVAALTIPPSIVLRADQIID
jgi:hypothetical protein